MRPDNIDIRHINNYTWTTGKTTVFKKFYWNKLSIIRIYY